MGCITAIKISRTNIVAVGIIKTMIVEVAILMMLLDAMTAVVGFRDHGMYYCN